MKFETSFILHPLSFTLHPSSFIFHPFKITTYKKDLFKVAKVFYENDEDLGLLKNKTVAIIGFGSQGHAHALNLKDSGVNVVVGLPPTSRSVAKAMNAGLKVMSVTEAAKAADFIMMLVPDVPCAAIYKQEVEPYLTAGKTLMFALICPHRGVAPTRGARLRRKNLDFVSLGGPGRPGNPF